MADPPCCSGVGAKLAPETLVCLNDAIRQGGQENSLRRLVARFSLPYTALQQHRLHVLAASAPSTATTEEAGPGPGPGPARLVDLAQVVPPPKSNVIHGDFGPIAPKPSKEDRAAAERNARKSAADDARARGMIAAQSADSFDARVGHVADLIVAGEYAGRPTAKALAAIWCVDLGTVQNYARAAALLTRADRGAVEAARELSLGSWRRLLGEAREVGDTKAAVAAQAGWDRAAGIVEPGGSRVQVNVLQAPGVQSLMRVVLQALADHPEARDAVLAAVRAELEGQAAPRAIGQGA